MSIEKLLGGGGAKEHFIVFTLLNTYLKQNSELLCIFRSIHYILLCTINTIMWVVPPINQY